jgi:ABC-type bacteriocin/lantibiotic exporter with double-glycine peptidase domain
MSRSFALPRLPHLDHRDHAIGEVRPSVTVTAIVVTIMTVIMIIIAPPPLLTVVVAVPPAFVVIVIVVPILASRMTPSELTCCSADALMAALDPGLLLFLGE